MTPAVVAFEVPGEPVPAQRARVMRGGWSFTPKRTAEAEARVAAEWKRRAGGYWFTTGAVAVCCTFYVGTLRRKDVDNLTKTILDGLTKGGAWGDDSQVKELHAKVRLDRANPRTFVELVALESESWGTGEWCRIDR